MARSTRLLRIRKLLGVVLWMAAAAAVLAYALVPSGAGVGEGRLDIAVTPLLPDLGMAPVDVCCVGIGEDGTWVLRFTATIVNNGEGDFIVRANRRSRFTGWSLSQEVAERGDGFTVTEAAGADLIWGGDGHDHWHVAEIETHWLETMDASSVIGTVVKPGFCFFDTTEHDLELPRAPASATWAEESCGDSRDTSVRMGLSVGWGDTYEWHLFDQHIDITGLEPGRYRIVAEADPNGWFSELDESNNRSSTVIELSIDADGLPHVAVIEGSSGT